MTPPVLHTAPVAPATALVLVCAWCTDRWNGERWVSAPADVPVPPDAMLSHGLCPSCAEVHFPMRRAG